MPAHVKRVIAWIRVEMERKKKGTTELIGERERERDIKKKRVLNSRSNGDHDFGHLFFLAFFSKLNAKVNWDHAFGDTHPFQ